MCSLFSGPLPGDNSIRRIGHRTLAGEPRPARRRPCAFARTPARSSSATCGREEVRMIAKRANNKFLLLTAGVLFSGTFLMAQDPGGMPGGGMQQPTPGTAPGYPGSQPMPGATGPGGSPGSQPSVADQAFIRHLFESDAVEVQLGQLAQEK